MNYKAAPQHSSEYAGKKKDHYHNPDGSFSFTKSQAEKRKKPKMTKKLEPVEKKAAPQMKYSAATQMGHSPAEMSPLDGHCGPMKMESAKQEKYNLMHDNPVAKHASGGSWMSKHSKSALRMGHSPAEMGHESPAKNLGHGMDDMSPEKGAHRKHHLKQRMSKKSKDSINK